MRKLWTLIAIVCAAEAEAGPALGEPLWEAKGLRTPESVLVHELDGRKVLLVSEIEGEASSADGAGGIALLGADGRIIDRDYIRGLNAPKGMAVHGNTLYVSDIDALVEIDLGTRRIRARHAVPGAKFLNDVAADDQGHVYVSDSGTGKVHRLADGRIDTYLEDLDGVNGLYVAKDGLYIGAAKRLLRARKGQVVEVATGFEEDIDGVEALGDGGFIVSCWVGLVYQVSPTGEVTKLYESGNPKLNTADIGYDRETNTLYVPTFLSNSVRAYAL